MNPAVGAMMRVMTMTRKELFEWLNTCPKPNWDTVADDYGFVIISFKPDETEKEE
jgi:hypothetical protein